MFSAFPGPMLCTFPDSHAAQVSALETVKEDFSLTVLWMQNETCDRVHVFEHLG